MTTTNDARDVADVADDGSVAFARARSGRVVESRRHRVDESSFRGKTRLTSHDPSMSTPPARTRRGTRVVVASRPSTPKTSTLDRSGRDDDDDDARVSTVSIDRRRTGGTDGPTETETERTVR